MARLVSIAAVLAVALSGCGGDDGGDDPPAHAHGEKLSVYVSVPRTGPDGPAGAAVLAGARRALADAGGEAGGKQLRIVPTYTTRPQDDETWDPGTVEAGADRAAEDASTIAYIGETGRGASAVSLPVTNRRGILQVSPLDSLTSLTRRAPGKPRAGPERYYPDGRRTFVRLVPNDLAVTAALAQLSRGNDRVVLVSGGDIGARELASSVANRLRSQGREPVDQINLRNDPGAISDAVDDVVEARPGAVILTGSGEPAAAPLLAGLAGKLDAGVPVLTDAGLVTTARPAPRPARTLAVSPVLPAAAQPARGRRLLGRGAFARPEGLYGYAAMAAVLDAVSVGGSHRAAVTRAARATGSLATPIGRLAVRRSGDAGRAAVAVYRVPPDGGATFDRLSP